MNERCFNVCATSDEININKPKKGTAFECEGRKCVKSQDVGGFHSHPLIGKQDRFSANDWLYSFELSRLVNCLGYDGKSVQCRKISPDIILSEKPENMDVVKTIIQAADFENRITDKAIAGTITEEDEKEGLWYENVIEALMSDHKLSKICMEVK